ncbi:MAG: hypothetical protein JWL73_415 [Actinomycetia bacterium]|nr:hypothetical protein [Actinomycetes bacterium]
MSLLIAASRNDQLLLAAVLAGLAVVFLGAGAVSAWLARRARAHAREVTERDQPDDSDGPTTTA